MLTKLISFVLIAGSLCLGTVAASTAYLPKLSAVPRPGGEEAAALTLGAPAGGEPGGSPLATTGTKLTDAVLDELAAADPPVDRVKVKEFSLGRWDLAWLFGLSVVGLFSGAMVVRLDARRRIAAMGQASGGSAAADRTPRETLVAAHERISTLRDAGGGAADARRRQSIIHELDAARTAFFEPFVEMRPVIVAAVGMSGYARVMDAFASAERAFNRAWSAAADGYPLEAEESLVVGLDRLHEAIERAPG